MSDKKLKNLEEHNKQRREKHTWLDGKPQHNGIACPKCGAELVDSRPGVVLTTYPCKVNIACPTCGYQGYRYV